MRTCTEAGSGSYKKEQSASPFRVSGASTAPLPEPWIYWEAWMSLALAPWLQLVRTLATSAGVNERRVDPLVADRPVPDNVVYLDSRRRA